MKILNPLFNMKLVYKLIIANVLCILLPVVLLGYNSYVNLYGQIQAQGIRDASEQLQQRAGLIRENVTSVESFSANIGYGSYLSSFLSDRFDNTPDTFENYRQIASNLNSLIGSNSKLISAISIYYKNDSIPEKWPLFYNISRMDGAYLKGFAIDAPASQYKPSFFYDEEDVSYIQPLVSGISSSVIGYLKTVVNKDSLFSSLIPRGSDSFRYFVADAGGKVLFDPSGITKDVLPLIEGMKDQRLTKNGLLILRSDIQSMNLSLYVVSSQKETIKNSLGAQRNILIVVILGVIAASLASWLLVSLLMRKLNRVLGAMRDVSKGDFSRRADINSRDEAGVLASAFNYMLDNIQQLRDMLVNRERHLKEAEINALQNQINPHFIYNILEVFKARLEFKNETEISNALYSVGRMLRYSTNWSQESALGQEIQHVEHYIKLQRMNQDKKIVFFIQSDKHIWNCRMPKMILQPLVENCILHGVTNRSELHITVSAHVENEKLYIEVFDDGNGLRADRMEQILQELEDSRESGETEKLRLSGIGLKNIHDRLRLMYGVEFGLRLQSEEDLYTKVTAVIPYMNETEEG